MFCIYKTSRGPWVAEYIERGKLKVSATAQTPIDSIEKLFEMIAGDDDETGTYAEIDGAQPCLPSGNSESTECGYGMAVDWPSGKRSG